MNNKLKKLFSHLKYTPLHPQWFSFRELRKFRKTIRHFSKGLIIDIGCADKYLERVISDECIYLGLDYYITASDLYNTKPEVYGNAQQLPFAEDCAETVALLEVLEHLPNPDNAFSEACRILKQGGVLILTVPFLYPVHDAPYDYQRWTKHGLNELFNKHKLNIIEQDYRGKPTETAALMCNIAATKQTINLLKNHNPLFMIAIPLLAIFIPITNALGWLFSFMGGNDDLMPFGYQVILQK